MKRPTKGKPEDELGPVGLSLETPTRVFISYRREDTGDTAAHLRHSLGRTLGPEKIFRDMDTIQPGQNFETVINEALRSTSVCLVLIGPRWLTLKDDKGRRRLDVPNDLVRIEVETALRLGVEVIPLLVDGARTPPRNQLPESIRKLASINAYELPWIAGITKLATRIGQIERAREAREAAERAARDRLDLTKGRQIVPGKWRSNSAARFREA
jgi:TIR domain